MKKCLCLATLAICNFNTTFAAEDGTWAKVAAQPKPIKDQTIAEKICLAQTKLRARQALVINIKATMEKGQKRLERLAVEEQELNEVISKLEQAKKEYDARELVRLEAERKKKEAHIESIDSAIAQLKDAGVPTTQNSPASEGSANAAAAPKPAVYSWPLSLLLG